MRLSPVDQKILKILRESKEPLSTYEIGKKTEMTWSTANSHCYKLKSMRLIDGKTEKSKFGLGEKIVWWIK